MKKFEPLKGKIKKNKLWKTETKKGFLKKQISLKEAGSYKWFFADDVKSAVQGLLEEIEKEKLKHISLKEDYETGFYDGLDFAIEKIKEWFTDVVKDED